MSNPKFEDYNVEIRRLTAEDGGGYVITFPDLPGCMSDGETPDEALANGRDAFEAWMDTCRSENRAVPAPGSRAQEAARFVQRLPRYLHESLTAAAFAQGISVNTLVTAFVAEGLARFDANPQRDEIGYIKGAIVEGVGRDRGIAYAVVTLTGGKPTPSRQPESVTSSGAESKTNVFEASTPANALRYMQ